MNNDRFFSRLEAWVSANLPAWAEIRGRQGWLRGAREAQGLRGQALAKKLGVSPARVSMLERDELRGAVTLKTMQKTAQALDCEFVYMLIPKKALRDSTAATAKPKIRVSPSTDRNAAG